ncbi:MAG TPA: hypothetical protein VIL55_14220 [Naasia sp.]
MTCEQAEARSKWDLHYRTALAAGEAPLERETFTGEALSLLNKPGTPVLVAVVEEPVLPTPTFEREERGVAEKRNAVRDVNQKHGTRTGYNYGCRLGDECPAKLAGGMSCTEANRNAQRDAATRRREGSPAAVVPSVAPKPTAPKSTPPDLGPVDERLAELTRQLAQARRDLLAERERSAMLALELDVEKTRPRPVPVLRLELQVPGAEPVVLALTQEAS